MNGIYRCEVQPHPGTHRTVGPDVVDTFYLTLILSHINLVT